MDKLRRALARLVLTLDIPTLGWVMLKMSDPEYIPAPGWVIGIGVLLLATMWSVQYSEITYTRVKGGND
jgi:hypothetical protein